MEITYILSERGIHSEKCRLSEDKYVSVKEL